MDLVGDVGEEGGGDDGVVGDAVAADGERRDEGEVGGADEGGVALELHQLPWAHQDGPELEDRERLPRPRRHGRLQVEERDLRTVAIGGGGGGGCGGRTHRFRKIPN